MTTAFFKTLLSVGELQALQNDGASPIVIDTRFDLVDANSGEASFNAGHIRGSMYMHLDRDMCGPKTGRNGRHPLPVCSDFAATVGRFGITPATQVVALDAQGGMYAARLWWMLRWLGHDAVAVLDGGTAAWTAAGGALDTDTAAPQATAPYPDRSSLVRSVDADTLAASLGRVRLIDARAGERFRGEIEPLDKAAGHIPGASNRFYKDNLGANGQFKTAAQLHSEFSAVLGLQSAESTVHQCGSGVTACHNLLAMEHAGLAGSALYPGSWSEWSCDPARPIARSV
jgi:thiosulfate/3-mercaptopyruvate sulfurtransferase